MTVLFFEAVRVPCAHSKSNSTQHAAPSSTFRSIALGPRLTPLAVSSTRALQSSMRLPSASAEKPPKTTLCIAPMRAHASIAIGSSHTIGI